MAAKYSVVEKIKPGDPAAPKKFYAQVVNTGEVSLRQLAKQISSMSTVTSIDTLAVLEALVQVVPDHVSEGKVVNLGDLGKFHLRGHSEGSDTAETVSANNIKSVKMGFRPGRYVKEELSNVTFEKTK